MIKGGVSRLEAGGNSEDRGMMINPLTTLPVTAEAIPGALARTNAAFSETLERIADGAGYAARRKEAEEAATGVVSQALILPILKQIRRSPFNQSGPFSPGTGEKTFGTEFDMQIADRIAQSPRLGIKKTLADRLMKRGQASMKTKVDVHG
jgi:hypothetical protein